MSYKTCTISEKIWMNELFLEGIPITYFILIRLNIKMVLINQWKVSLHHLFNDPKDVLYWFKKPLEDFNNVFSNTLLKYINLVFKSPPISDSTTVK